MKSQAALQEAQRIAHERSHQEVDGEHLLLAMIGQSDSLIPALLEKIGVQPSSLGQSLEQELARRHKVQGTSSVDAYLSNSLKKVLEAAQAEATKLNDILEATGLSKSSLYSTFGDKRELFLTTFNAYRKERLWHLHRILNNGQPARLCIESFFRQVVVAL